MDEVNYTYDGKFEGNILVIGRTGYEKLHSNKTWERTNYLETLRRSIGSRKLNFLQIEKTISETILRINM